MQRTSAAWRAWLPGRQRAPAAQHDQFWAVCPSMCYFQAGVASKRGEGRGGRLPWQQRRRPGGSSGGSAHAACGPWPAATPLPGVIRVAGCARERRWRTARLPPLSPTRRRTCCWPEAEPPRPMAAATAQGRCKLPTRRCRCPASEGEGLQVAGARRPVQRHRRSNGRLLGATAIAGSARQLALFSCRARSTCSLFLGACTAQCAFRRVLHCDQIAFVQRGGAQRRWRG